jgi:hypothetical protein
MPNAVNKVKYLSAEANFWEAIETYKQPAQDALTETERPVDANNKLKKLDLFRINQGRMDTHALPKSANWNVTDGDYIYEMTENEERQIYSIEERKKLEKIYFGVALVFASLITLFFSFIASSIKNF